MLNFLWKITVLFIVGVFIVACTESVDYKAAAEKIDLESYSAHLQKLASDEFMGRAPSAPGEEKTIQYLKSEFTKLGLEPGNNGDFFQEVPLVSIVSTPDSEMVVKGNGGEVRLPLGSGFVGLTRRMVDAIELENSEMIFAGYGIVAPEFGWDDYKDIDVKGKTVVVMVNDPGFATKDSSFFSGRTMTYYGRWTYKYEEAVRQGADGIIIIHETAPAGYPWFVVQSGWSGPEFYMVPEDRNMSRCKFEGWISGQAARKLFALAGQNYSELVAAASTSEHQSRKLGLSYSLKLTNTIENSTSYNVLAMIPGSDLKDEFIIYTAHWDHFGVNPEIDGDNIFNGARDNATGTAALLAIAKGYKALDKPLRRSVLFMAVTAEEQGLLGSAYYAANPVYPLAKTAGVINMDALNIFGKMKDITVVGLGNSELDEYVEIAAKAQNRYIRPDPEPEKGLFFRSDHFSFAKQGVPAMYTKMGIDHVTKSQEEILEASARWTAELYHKPGDEYDASTWDLTGTIDDLRLLFHVGFQLANESRFPNWYEGNAFKEKRDADMKK